MEIKALNDYKDVISLAIELATRWMELNDQLLDTMEWLKQSMQHPTVVLTVQDRDRMSNLQQMMHRYYSTQRQQLILKHIEPTAIVLDQMTDSRLLLAKLDMWLNGWHVVFR